MCPKEDYFGYANKFGAQNYILGASSPSPNAMKTGSNSGLADLERAFGRGSELMASDHRRPTTGNEENNLIDDQRSPDEDNESEIDCEE